MEQYFPFHKLQEYMEIFDAIWIFLAVIFTVYVLSSLYYWTWSDQHVRHSDAPKNDKDLT